MSAVGAGVLVLGGATGVHAVQRDEPVRPSYDLASAADSRTAPEDRGTGELVPFRIRLEGPGTGARLAVATAPPWALRGVLCPMKVTSPVPIPRGVAVCRLGDLPARGGSVDVLLDVPAYARDIMVTAVARMRAPGGATVTQQARGLVRLPEGRPIRPAQGQVRGQTQGQQGQARGTVSRYDRMDLTRPVGELRLITAGPAQGMAPGTSPGTALGAPGSPSFTIPGSPSGAVPGMSSGTAPGTPGTPGTPGAPGMSPGAVPGTPGSPSRPVPGAPGTPSRAVPGSLATPGIPSTGTARDRSVPGAPEAPVAAIAPGQGTRTVPVPGRAGAPAGIGAPDAARPVPTPPPGAGQAAAPQNVTAVNVGEADQRVLVALLDALVGRPVTPGPRPVAPGTGAGTVPGNPAPGVVAGGPGVPGGRPGVSAVAPGGASQPGGGTPGTASTPSGTTTGAPGVSVAGPGAAPGTAGTSGATAGRPGVPGMTGTAPATGRQPARTPVTPATPQGGENANNPALDPGMTPGAVRGVAGQQRSTGRAGTVRQGAARPAGPGRAMSGQRATGRAGAHAARTGPVVGRSPITGQRPVGRPVFPGPGMPQGLPQNMIRQLGALPPGMGAPMTGRQPGGPGRKQAGRQASGLTGGSMSGPMGPGHPSTGHPGIGQPGYGPAMIGPGSAGQAGAGRQMPGAQMPGAQMPGAQMPGMQMPGMSPQGVHGPQGPQGPQASQQGQMPPMTMGMAGTLQMPGTVDGSQLRLPPAGPFPAGAQGSVQAAAPQGAPLPQDLGAPDGRPRPMAESSSSLTGIGGLPVVALAVATLLGLLWLQRRIQRRRRSRSVL
ncbi:hypothetical protein ACLQ2R_28190 [Streptosporangium sp. DT93]|uniref:hypothetical protein n=1 Tax=Streptosporangium sp. DT93 TaxID=3393428 RepID=UPI003CFAEC2C